MFPYLLPRPVVVVWCILLLLAGARAGQGQPPGRAALDAAEVVVLRNEDELLPLQRLDTLRLATLKAQVAAAPRGGLDFSWYLPHDVADYAPTSFFVGPQPADLAQLRRHNLLLLALPEGGPHDRTALRQTLALGQKTIVLVFDSAALATLPELRQAAAVVLVKARSMGAVNHAVQVIFGGIGTAVW